MHQMGWLLDRWNDDDAAEISPGSLRRRDGHWVAVVRVKGTDPDGGAAWRQLTHDTGLAADESTRGRAEVACRRWRDAIVVRATLVRAERIADAHTAELLRPRGVSERLAMGFEAYATHWLEVKRSVRGVAPATLRGYAVNIRLLVRHMPRKPIAAITTEDIEGTLAAIFDEGYSPTTAKKCMNVAVAVFRRAVLVDGLQRSPCEGVATPAQAPPRQNALGEEGWLRLLGELAAMRQTPAVCAGRLALLMGVTREEICALTWGDWGLAEETGELRIECAIALGETGYERRKPKTRARVRTIPLTDAAREAGEERRREAEAEWKEDGRGLPGPDDYMVGHTDGTWLVPSTLSTAWSTLSHANGWKGEKGLALTLHDLRHTFATRLVASGADVKSTSRIMGHSTPSTTLKVYVSEDDGAKRKAMRGVERALGGKDDDASAEDDAKLVGALARAIRSAMADE